MARDRWIALALLLLLPGSPTHSESALDNFASESAILHASCPIALSLLTQWPSPGINPSVQAQVLAAYVAGFLDGIPSLQGDEFETAELMVELQRRCTLHIRQAAKAISSDLSEDLFHEGVQQGLEDARSEFEYLDDRPNRWQ